MSKTLVAYFSHSGNSKVIAEMFMKMMNADIYEIKAMYAYSQNTIQ